MYVILFIFEAHVNQGPVAACIAGDKAGDKGLAAVPKRQADFTVVLGTAIEYAKALQCPRQVNKLCVIVHQDREMLNGNID